MTSVTWAKNHTAVSITNGGVATFGTNSGSEYDVTLTPTLKHSSYSSADKTPTGKAVHVVPVTEAISLNTEKTVTTTTGGQSKWYRYTPTTSGTYIAFSYKETSLDTQIWIYQNGDDLNLTSTTSGTGNVAYNDDFTVKEFIAKKEGVSLTVRKCVETDLDNTYYH